MLMNTMYDCLTSQSSSRLYTSKLPFHTRSIAFYPAYNLRDVSCRIEQSLAPLFKKEPEYKKIFETAQIPERVLQVSSSSSMKSYSLGLTKKSYRIVEKVPCLLGK